ncbi:hypothetical protein CERSUDRAFT_140685 [Gelatoporia subvermispora B]|uniref:Uncharacterized protein n=1 Tax=Ceriporiopsis subvermispora (strain B) TaxID=914234 RepID=M2R7B3_CERS8|nr:hypothetical protein CERSUDRAFT_140685 [Gelatoporia subvermispora B]
MQGGRYGTALQTATTGRHLQLVRLLIDHGANVNAESGEFGTALVAACAGGYDDIARLLVKKGADVKARDSGGRTALQIAMDEDNFPDFIHFDSQYDEVRAGRRTIAALLREHGADV